MSLLTHDIIYGTEVKVTRTRNHADTNCIITDKNTVTYATTKLGDNVAMMLSQNAT